MKNIEINKMKEILGGTYYGNGVYVDSKNGIHIDWSRVWSCVGQYSLGGFLGGAVLGKC